MAGFLLEVLMSIREKIMETVGWLLGIPYPDCNFPKARLNATSQSAATESDR